MTREPVLVRPGSKRAVRFKNESKINDLAAWRRESMRSRVHVWDLIVPRMGRIEGEGKRMTSPSGNH